jgi:hypothetical protein
MSDLYEITCEGEYYGYTESGRKVTRPYTLVWKANEVMRQTGFLSVFKNALTPKDGKDTAIIRMMREKYPDYKRYKTHHVVNAINLTKKNAPVRELALMNRNQVIQFLNQKGIPIDSDLYPSVSELRQALKDYHENPDAFKKNQDKRRLIKGPQYAVIRGVEELNSVSEAADIKEQTPAYHAPDENEISIPDIDDKIELDRMVASLGI